MPSLNNIPPFYRKAPTRPVTDEQYANSGVSLLPSTITINGQTETAKLRYEGKNASASGWTATIGDDLPAVGSGGVFDNDTPFLDDTKSFDADGTREFQDDTTPTTVIGNNDFVIELVVKMDGGSTGFYPMLRTNPAGTGGNARIALSTHASNNNGLIQISDGVNVTNAAFPAMTNGAWYHLMVFGDRSGNVRGYGNGIGGGSFPVSAVGSLGDAGLALADGATFPGEIALAQLWHASGWLDSATQLEVAQERFHRLCGTYSRVMGTPVFTRASTATLTNDTGTYTVGRNWPRVEPDGLLINAAAESDLEYLYTPPQTGSIVATVKIPNEDTVADGVAVQLHNQTANENVTLRVDAGGDGAEVEIVDGGVSQGTVTGSTDISDGADHTVAVSYNANDVRLYVDNTSEGTPDTSATVPTTTHVSIGANQAEGSEFGGRISRVKLYDKVNQKK